MGFLAVALVVSLPILVAAQAPAGSDERERAWIRKAAAGLDVEQVRQALITWQPPAAAPLAAPGLSAHGQGRAFDFQILHGSEIVAGFEQSQAKQQWDVRGWTRRLHAASVSSGKPFSGPLQSPYEPWHYTYVPRP